MYNEILGQPIWIKQPNLLKNYSQENYRIDIFWKQDIAFKLTYSLIWPNPNPCIMRTAEILIMINVTGNLIQLTRS